MNNLTNVSVGQSAADTSDRIALALVPERCKDLISALDGIVREYESSGGAVNREIEAPFELVIFNPDSRLNTTDSSALRHTMGRFFPNGVIVECKPDGTTLSLTPRKSGRPCTVRVQTVNGSRIYTVSPASVVTLQRRVRG